MSDLLCKICGTQHTVLFAPAPDEAGIFALHPRNAAFSVSRSNLCNFIQVKQKLMEKNGKYIALQDKVAELLIDFDEFDHVAATEWAEVFGEWAMRKLEEHRKAIAVREVPP